MSDFPITQKAHGFEYEDGTRREVLQSTEDLDDTTGFSFNPTGLDEWHNLILRMILRDESGSANDVTLQAAGITSSDYRWRQFNSGTLTEITGQTEWTLGAVNTSYTASIEARVVAGSLDGTAFRPSVDASWAGYQGVKQMDAGDVNSTTSSVDSLNLSTAGNMVGYCVLIGELIGPP